MNLPTILSMVEAGHGDRLMLGTQADGLTGGEFAVQARRGGLQPSAHGARTVIFIGENGPASRSHWLAASWLLTSLSNCSCTPTSAGSPCGGAGTPRPFG
jgi:hypothetical protein